MAAKMIGNMLCVPMSVSVPGELREKMRKERHANWSKIAQDAFEDYISGKDESKLTQLRGENARLQKKLAMAEKKILEVLNFLAE